MSVDAVAELGDERSDEGLDRSVALAVDRVRLAVDSELSLDRGVAAVIARPGVQLVAAQAEGGFLAAGTRR